jgi:hypothetical protein
MALTDEELWRVHDKVRQTPAHIPITDLVNAARNAGWAKGKGLDDLSYNANVRQRRHELGKVIADMWERLQKAEARVAELSQKQEL